VLGDLNEKQWVIGGLKSLTNTRLPSNSIWQFLFEIGCLLRVVTERPLAVHKRYEAIYGVPFAEATPSADNEEAI
jgi:hypothetical protein